MTIEWVLEKRIRFRKGYDLVYNPDENTPFELNCIAIFLNVHAFSPLADITEYISREGVEIGDRFSSDKIIINENTKIYWIKAFLKSHNLPAEGTKEELWKKIKNSFTDSERVYQIGRLPTEEEKTTIENLIERIITKDNRNRINRTEAKKDMISPTKSEELLMANYGYYFNKCSGYAGDFQHMSDLQQLTKSKPSAFNLFGLLFESYSPPKTLLPEEVPKLNTVNPLTKSIFVSKVLKFLVKDVRDLVKYKQTTCTWTKTICEYNASVRFAFDETKKLAYNRKIFRFICKCDRLLHIFFRIVTDEEKREYINPAFRDNALEQLRKLIPQEDKSTQT